MLITLKKVCHSYLGLLLLFPKLLFHCSLTIIILKNILLFCFLIFSYLAKSETLFHGDIHERILKVTEEIKISPDSAFLFVKRGKLFFQHEEYKKCIDDLNTSLTLGYKSTEQTLQFAKSYNRLQKFTLSNTYIETVLSQNSSHVRAIRLKAKNYFSSGKYQEAGFAFEDVIKYSTKTFPENYIEASMAWELDHNKESDKYAEKVITKGIEKLGNVFSLFHRLRELAINREDYDKAIYVQKQIIDFMPRKEFAYFKLSELHVQNNDKERAIKCLDNSKKEIKKLPQRIQNSTFIKGLLKKIKSKEVSL